MDRLHLFLCVALGLAESLAAQPTPVSTCFTYQGRLRNNSGALISTPQDFRVTLYAQATGGSPVGNPSVNTSNCVPLANGLFTLTLCFGDQSSYNCQARWLEIGVRPCGTAAAYTVLTQRVELLSVPNAIQSLVACTVASNGVSAGSIPNGTITSNKIASGQVVKSLNGLHDDVNLVGLGGMAVVKNGNNLEISSPAGANIWRLNGASAYYDGGNVGVGTSTPISSSRLHSVAATGNGIQGDSADSIASGVYGYNTAQGNGVAGRSSGRGTAVLGDNPNPLGFAGSFNGRLYAAGNVGIGTANPSRRLEVQGAGDLEIGLKSTDVNGHLWTLQSTAGPSVFPNALLPWEGCFQIIDRTAGASRLSILTDGKVGFGTIAPRAMLSIVNGGPDFAGSAVSSTLQTSAGILPDPVGSESALASFGVKAGNEVSLGLRARRNTAVGGWTALSLGLTFDVDNSPEAGGGLWLMPDGVFGQGNVGIGTATPEARLDVADGDIMMSDGSTLRSRGRLHIQANEDLYLNPWNFTTHVGGGAQNSGELVVHGTLHANGIELPSSFGPDLSFAAPGNYIAFGHPGVSEDFIGYRDNTFFFKDSPGGGDGCDPTVEVAVLRVTGGCDLAEPFQMSDMEISRGAVVVIDEDHPGQLKLSERAYDHRVAGIVSGANGVKAGITLHQEGLIEGGQNVALSGRVYVQADASERAIKPGDLLTTSDTPGHAMKVGDHSAAQGAILGKAMSGLSKGKGMVLVLVSLQ